MSVRSTRVVPLPRDASADQIVDLCATTADLVAFRAALRWIEPESWLHARMRLAAALTAEEAPPGQDALADQRASRGRLALRFHKTQLVNAEDAARRAEARGARRTEPAQEADDADGPV